MTAEKVLENKLRRIATRRGYRLEKSRRRDSQAIGFGGYMVIDIDKNFVVCGGSPHAYSASLEDVADYFDEAPRRTKKAPERASQRRRGAR